MAWLAVFLAVVVDALVAFGLSRELPRWRESAFAVVAPLRILVGALLMLLILLLGIGVGFVLPNPGQGTPPGTGMLAYWLFIALLVGVIFLLTVLDLALVRRGYQRRQIEAFAAAMTDRNSVPEDHDS